MTFDSVDFYDTDNERDLNKWDAVIDPDILAEIPQRGAKHPTPEQLLFRMAVERALMGNQRKIWEMYNYDKLTFAQIARRLKTSRQNISQKVKTIERQLIAWVREHQEVYNVLKGDIDDTAGC